MFFSFIGGLFLCRQIALVACYQECEKSYLWKDSLLYIA